MAGYQGVRFCRVRELKRDIAEKSMQNPDTIYFDEYHRVIWLCGVPYGEIYDPKEQEYEKSKLEESIPITSNTSFETTNLSSTSDWASKLF